MDICVGPRSIIAGGVGDAQYRPDGSLSSSHKVSMYRHTKKAIMLNTAEP